MQIAKLPHSRKSPFEKWKEPTSEEILNSLDERLVIQGPSQSQWIELKFPIKWITTMIGSEIEAIRQALEKVQFQYKNERVVILSDCKFANLDKMVFLRFIGSKDILAFLEMNEQMQWRQTICSISEFPWIEPIFHWTNEGNEMEPKRYFEAQSFEKIILHRLEVHERRY
ncbi:hypothetical protein RFI_30364, partial [Reticulomyxa filosa]